MSATARGWAEVKLSLGLSHLPCGWLEPTHLGPQLLPPSMRISSLLSRSSEDCNPDILIEGARVPSAGSPSLMQPQLLPSVPERDMEIPRVRRRHCCLEDEAVSPQGIQCSLEAVSSLADQQAEEPQKATGTAAKQESPPSTRNEDTRLQMGEDLADTSGSAL